MTVTDHNIITCKSNIVYDIKLEAETQKNNNPTPFSANTCYMYMYISNPTFEP